MTLPTRVMERIALGLNWPSTLNLNWSLNIIARKRTTTRRIVSIKLTSHGTNKNLFSAETPEIIKHSISWYPDKKWEFISICICEINRDFSYLQWERLKRIWKLCRRRLECRKQFYWNAPFLEFQCLWDLEFLLIVDALQND